MERCGDYGGVNLQGDPCRRVVKHEGRCPQHANGDRAPAAPDAVVSEPRDWDKAVSAAYLWMVLPTVKAAAEGAGVGERTLQRWILSEWWDRAVTEARSRWLNHTVAAARRSLTRLVEDGNPTITMEVLRQFDPDFAPRPKEVRVLSVLAFVEQLPDAQVQQLMGLPEAERKSRLLRLAEQNGVALP